MVAGGQKVRAAALTRVAREGGRRGSRRASARSTAATCRHLLGTRGRNEPSKNSSLGVTARQRRCDRQNLVHPWRRPRAFSRKNPLHVYAEVDAALGQGKRQELVAHMGLSALCPSPRCHQAKAQEILGKAARSHLTSRMTTSCPAIATASPGPCVRSARARGDRWESVPREGSASSSPTILKLCSRPSSRRRLTVMPKDAVLLSSEVLTTSALARRAPQ